MWRERREQGVLQDPDSLLCPPQAGGEDGNVPRGPLKLASVAEFRSDADRNESRMRRAS